MRTHTHISTQDLACNSRHVMPLCTERFASMLQTFALWVRDMQGARGLADRWEMIQANQRAARKLAEMDDHLLQDVGLTRAQLSETISDLLGAQDAPLKLPR